MQVMYHFCPNNTLSSRRNYIQAFSVKLQKNANQNNTFRAFIEAKSSMVSSK